MRRRLPLLLMLPLSLALMGHGNATWRARRRPMPNPNRIAMARIAIADWPDEPESPGEVDPARYAHAMQQVCGWMPDERAARFTGYILEQAAAFDVDPFLLGALVYREGR